MRIEIINMNQTLKNNSSFKSLFRPKLATVLEEGYNLKNFRSDTFSGLTVAVIALPLSMAIAIACGVPPENGLYTAIVGGFLVSLLGGSRYQIGGPAGAFIILIAATVYQHGLEGLILATVLSGFMLMLMGYLRLGSFIKFIPYPVVVGFSAAIAIIIFLSQLEPLFGIDLSPTSVDMHAVLSSKLSQWQGMNLAAVALGFSTAASIAFLKWLKPNWPNILLVVVAMTLIATAAMLPVQTIENTFGAIPRTLPAPHWPDMTWHKVWAVLPAACGFALLGAIESLLSAVVADGLTGRRHRSNCELVAQGFANIGSGVFGGFCVTGTIARTVANVRSGAHSPVSGMMHSIFLLLIMLLAAPLAGYIPLSVLAGVLIVVAYNMFEKHAFWLLLRSSKGDALVLLATFGIVLAEDLTTGILAGFFLGSMLFIHRMSQAVSLDKGKSFAPEDKPDSATSDGMEATDNATVYHMSGAFFFGAAATLGAALDTIIPQNGDLVLDMAKVPFIDATAANVLLMQAEKAKRRGIGFHIQNASSEVRMVMQSNGLKPPLIRYI